MSLLETDEEVHVADERRDDLGELSDEELVARFREMKSEMGGSDPAQTPRAGDGALRDEMERRGLAPDREDLIPDDESSSSEPIVEDHV